MESFFLKYPFLLSLLIAEGVLLLAKNDDLKIILKNKKQRTKPEKAFIKNGLKKSLIVELILVPISLFILYFIAYIPLRESVAEISSNVLFSYGVLGLVAYGFPFSAIKKIVQKTALDTINNFAKIVYHATEEQKNHD